MCVDFCLAGWTGKGGGRDWGMAFGVMVRVGWLNDMINMRDELGGWVCRGWDFW